MAQEEKKDALKVSVVTPRGPVTAEDTDAVTAPGQLGEFEVLPGHVPFLTQLHPGVLVLGERERHIFAVSSGFLEVEPDGTVLVLVEPAAAARPRAWPPRSPRSSTRCR